MEWIHNIKPISLGLLAVSAFFAWMNGLGLWHNIRHNGSVSYAPLIGFIFFFFGTLGWNAPWYFWLLALLDIGTITGFLSLPFLIQQIFSQSIFTHFATYKNQHQIIKLYRAKTNKTFYWRWVGEIPADVVENQQHFMSGFGGDWEIVGNQLYLNTYRETLAIANILEDKIVFKKVKSSNYHVLENAVLWQKFKK